MADKALEFIINDFVQTNKNNPDMTEEEIFVISILDKHTTHGGQPS